MRLFYSPGACSLSPHIVLNELGLPFQAEKMDGKTHRTAGGVDFYSINPKGQVPALQLDDGQVLTEGAVIVQYLADRKPEAKLAPPAGTMERCAWHKLSYTTTVCPRSNRSWVTVPPI